MNIADFNSNFPSFEKQFRAQEAEDIKGVKEVLKNIQITKLANSYPNVSWNNLQRQREDMMTDDACTHYLDKTNGLVYSWNFSDEEWIQHSEDYQKSLLKFFN